ncbi:hypothetical protein L6164_028933 [Bauhinia variegata]|uniref:Uncharacterized protein n=1 Tax=Bauhinia variegata TaxID=167791 RepID=A0ACB9L800_BAUVA|nr:hypothetical protein L6164_028933 [Bauhinia variegata]
MMIGEDWKLSLNGTGHKVMKMAEVRDWRPWSDLPEDLIGLIAKHLGMIDYILFGCVCKSWKSYVSAHRQDFMASQSPHILLLPAYIRSSCCFLYNISDKKNYKALLPSLIGKLCLGIAGGYLVFQNKHDNMKSPLWLLNPITRHELHFPSSPYPLCRVILASSTVPRGEYVIVGFSPGHPYLQFFRSSDSHWTVHKFQIANPWGFIVDGAFFKGKIYFLTSHGKIGVFDPSSAPYFKLLEVKRIRKRIGCKTQLVASNEHLLVIRKADNRYYEVFEVYELNFLTKSWIRQRSLGDQVLFIGDCEGTLPFCTEAKWEGCEDAQNCSIFSVGYSGERFTAHSLDTRCSKEISIEPGGRMPTFLMDRAFWYFPQLACKVDSLSQ